MTLKERIFHAILFELILLALSVAAARMFTDHDSAELGGMFVAISLLALLLNVVFNWLFDRLFPGERIARGLWLRVLHAVAFELTLMVLTVPLIMYVLDIGLWTAIAADFGMAVGVMAYTFVYNYLYDHIRAKVVRTCD